jgi:lysozyme
LAMFERTVGVCAVEADTNENQFSAMVSLAYNIGLKAFQSSSVLRLHRLQDHQRAADAFLMWNKGGGKVLPGLVTRRANERKLYLL